MEEEEEESIKESAKSLAKKQTSPSLWHRAVRFGKTVAIAGVAIASAPVVIPPAVVGFAFSVPFGVYFAGLVYTENVLRALFLSNCQYEIVKNQDVQVVAQDNETSPTSLYYSNANPEEEIEIEQITQDDTSEKYYDGGTYVGTNNVLYTVQETENTLTTGSDERSGDDDIYIIMQSSQDDKCNFELPISSNNAECGGMIFPVHFEDEAHNEAGRRDLDIQHTSENDNDRNSDAEIYYEEKKKLSELQQHGYGLGIEALRLNEALHRLEERSTGEKDDIKELDDIKENDDMKKDDMKKDGIKEDVGYSFNVAEPIVEMKGSDIREDDESMNEDMDTNERNSNVETYSEEEKNSSKLQHGCDLGIEELRLNEALHKMEDRVIAEKDRTHKCDNTSFIVLEQLVENDERDVRKDDESMNEDMKLDDLELDSMDLMDASGKENCASEDDGKIKDEVDNETIETTVFGNDSTRDSESEYGSVHIINGDNTHGETNQSVIGELNEFGIESPVLDNKTDEHKEKVIEENDKRTESYPFPIATNQPLDGNTEAMSLCENNDQIGDELLDSPVQFDKQGTGALEQERDDTSAKMDLEHETALQPNPNEEEINMKHDEMGESYPTKLENDDAGQIDYIELKDDIIMGTENEEDNRISTEMSDEHPREVEIDDINWDTRKEEEEIPLLANIETDDEMKGNIEENEKTEVDMEQKMESSDNMSDLTNVTDENLNLEEMENNVKVQEETSESQPKTSYLFAAVMPKEVESENVDHKNEKGTLEVKQQELTGDGNFMAKDDKPLEELPTVPEEREINFEFPDLSSEKALSTSISNLNRVEEKTTENQPKTDLLAAMSKKFENEVADHSKEMGISDSEKQELNIDGSSMAKNDESVGDLPTVPEEQELNFEFFDPSSKQALLSNLNRADKNVDSTEGRLDMLGEETKDEARVETNKAVEQIPVIESIAVLAPVEYEHEHENVESGIGIEYACDIENHSSDITSAESRAEVAIVEGSEVVHFHDEVTYSEDTIWEQIQALRTIIGCNAAMHSSLIDELKALYLLIGVEPPASLEETSDLIEVTEKLEFLKSVIGVK